MNRYTFRPVKQTFSVSVNHMNFKGDALLGTTLHSHRHEELHLLTAGAARYTVGTEQYVLRAGDLLYIPRQTLHELQPMQPQTRFYVIEGLLELGEQKLVHVPEAVLQQLIGAGQQAEARKDPSVLTPWILYLLGLLSPGAFTKVEERSDDGNTLLRYIATNYHRDITLADAAGEANLSQRQAQRLIRSYTNRTFLQELTLQRMTVAAHLMDHTELPLEEIAQYVGYQSYSGFWKAWQKYRKDTGQKPDR